jgi:hypothetical protein
MSDIGFSITSFLDTLSYENRLLYEQINLHTGYLHFHHCSQNGYLDKTSSNMETFGSVIDKEILVNHKNAKTESMAKLNIIKQNNCSDSLLDNLLINIKVDAVRTDDNGDHIIETEKVDAVLTDDNGDHIIEIEDVDVNHTGDNGDHIIETEDADVNHTGDNGDHIIETEDADVNHTGNNCDHIIETEDADVTQTSNNDDDIIKQH